VHPGVDPAQAQANTGWPLRIAATLATTEPPSARELQILRELDPSGVYLNSAGG